MSPHELISRKAQYYDQQKEIWRLYVETLMQLRESENKLQTNNSR